MKTAHTHPVPVIINSTRSINITPIQTSSSSLSGYRTPPTNGRPLENVRQMDNGDNVSKPETSFSSVLVEKGLRHNSSLYDTKYDNCTSTNGRIKSDTITLVLQRDQRILDFGFSISDRLYGTGVYVNKIRPNGPAEVEGTLVPCMRIYKVGSNENFHSILA